MQYYWNPSWRGILICIGVLLYKKRELIWHYVNVSQKNKKIIGPTRIRTGVVRIKTESDNHYTIEP